MGLVLGVASAIGVIGAAAAPETTPVSGPSWIEHLGAQLDDTPMGKMGGAGPPSRSPREEPMPGEGGGAPFVLTGADLYRLSCRSCHGPAGQGAPPAILPLRDPVRATSPAVLELRAEEKGRKLSPELARSLAADAEKTVRDRLLHGGKHMPPFPQLSSAEVDALLQYLRTLAGVPERGPVLRVQVSVTHAGEDLVKGTCRICHPATGPGVNRMAEYMRGIIPSLAAMPAQLPADAVLSKVLSGGGGMMGGGMMGGGMMGGGMMGRGRMPVFDYLTEQEVLAAYLYLYRYPPEP